MTKPNLQPVFVCRLCGEVVEDELVKHIKVHLEGNLETFFEVKQVVTEPGEKKAKK